jgi:hypothetical protein
MEFTPTEVCELVMAIGVSSSIFLTVLVAALRFAVRPLISDWAKLRGYVGSDGLERRMATLEEEIRELKAAGNLQLPAESLRSPGHPRT